MNYVVGVDIGGTFTDCVVVDEAGQSHHRQSAFDARRFFSRRAQAAETPRKLSAF